MKKSLVSRGESIEGYRFELSGGATVRPDCSGLHQGSPIWQELPEAFVLINLFKGEMLQEQALVMFRNSTPDTLFSPRERNPFSEGTMNRAELRQIAPEMDAFFSVAVDIARGPERFYPYLPDDIRSLLKHPDENFRMFMPLRAVNSTSFDQEVLKEKLSDTELRQFIALQLDGSVQALLLVAEGYMAEFKAMESRQRLKVLRSNPREYIKGLEESVSNNRRLCEKAGILTRAHFGPYCRLPEADDR